MGEIVGQIHTKNLQFDLAFVITTQKLIFERNQGVNPLLSILFLCKSVMPLTSSRKNTHQYENEMLVSFCFIDFKVIRVVKQNSLFDESITVCMFRLGVIIGMKV